MKKIINADDITPKNTSMLRVRKKPVIVHAVQMTRPFETTTLEGKIQGKAGDYLMYGVRGERYPIDKDIFNETYDVIQEEEQVEEDAVGGGVSGANSLRSVIEEIVERDKNLNGVVDEILRRDFGVTPSFADAVKECISKDPVKWNRGVDGCGAIPAMEIEENPLPWEDGGDKK